MDAMPAAQGADLLRARWAQGRHTTNAWLSVGSGYVAEILGHLPYDSVTVDMQHGMFGFDAAIAMLQAISSTPAVPLARVASNEPWMIQRTLDAGAAGVICPMINSRDDCERFVRSACYSPEGTRSFGPARGLLVGGPDYVPSANRRLLTLAMIETVAAVEQLDEIVSVEGLGGIYIGPSDLAMDLEGTVRTPPSDAVVERATEVARRAKALRPDIVVGVFCPDTDFARSMRSAGCDMLTIMNDVGLLRLATARLFEQMKDSGVRDKSPALHDHATRTDTDR